MADSICFSAVLPNSGPVAGLGCLGLKDRTATEEKTIMILGGSADQLFAIQTAQSMGLFVIVADQNPRALGFRYADDYAVISTRDIPALVSFIRSYRKRRPLHGVMTMGSEIPMSVAMVAEELESPAISRDIARLASDKLAMKQRWAECGIPVPWFQEITSVAELRRIIRERGYSLVIKPIDRSGARGVYRLWEKADLEELVAKAKSYSYVGRVMVEEYIEGPQESTESIVYDDFFCTPGFSDRNYELNPLFHPNMIENGGTMPPNLSGEARRSFEELLEKAARALGIERGVAKGDGVICPRRGPIMFEMAARLSGGHMSSGLIPVSTGINIVETMLEISVGNVPDLSKLTPRWEKGAALRYFFPNPGVLKGIVGLEKVMSQSWLKALDLSYSLGDYVPWPLSHSERFGGFLVEGDTRLEAEARAQQVYDTVRIMTELVDGT